MVINIKYQGSLHVVVQLDANEKIVGVGPFWSHGHTFYKVQWQIISNIKTLDLEVSDKKKCLLYLYITYVEHKPLDWAPFVPEP